MKSKHEISTYFLIALFALIGITTVTALFTSEDIDEICDLDQHILYRSSGEWMCGSLNDTINYTINNITQVVTNFSIYANNSLKWNGKEFPSLTNGSVVFYDGFNFAEDNSKFYWNDNLNWLGIGTNTPVSPLHIWGSGILEGKATIENELVGGGTTIDFRENGTNTGFLLSSTDVGGKKYFQFGAGAIPTITIEDGKVGIGTQEPDYELDVVGDVNVTQSLFVGDDVGIGTTSPSRKLHIHNPNATNVYQKFTHSGTGTTTADGFDFLMFNNDGYLTNRESSGKIILRGGDGNDNLVIGSDGNVGVGESTPAYTLDVDTADSESLVASFRGGISASKWIGIGLGHTQTSSKAGLIYEDTGTFNRGTLHLAVDNDANNKDVNLTDAKLSITKLGDVGIGTTTPQSELDVVGDVNISDDLFVADRVGIGTQSPQTILHVQTDTNDFAKVDEKGAFLLSRPTSSFGPAILLQQNGVTTWQVKIDRDGGNDDTLSWATATEEVIAMEQDGSVGIGTATPDFKLQVNGTIAPEADSLFSIGSSTLRWLKGWFTDVDVAGNLNQTEGNATINNIYGGMFYHNHTGTELNFAVDGQYYGLFFTNSTHINGFNFNGGFLASSNLTAEHSGLYHATYMSSGDGQNNHDYHTTIFINDEIQDNCENHHKMTAGGDVVTQSGNCFIYINVGDNISIRTADMGSIGTGNYYSANLNLLRIGN